METKKSLQKLAYFLNSYMFHCNFFLSKNVNIFIFSNFKPQEAELYASTDFEH